MTQHAYGHKAPRVPHRSLRLHLVAPEAAPTLPADVDLRPLCPPVVDQGQAGSCTGCGSMGAIGLISIRAQNDGAFTGAPFIGSALTQYWQEREIDGTTGSDAGASIADAVLVMSENGIAPDADYPYDASAVLNPPPPQALADMARVKLADYAPVANDATTIKACLAMGFPVLVGVAVYDSFEAAWQPGERGDVPLPNTVLEANLGGHCIVIVGYSDELRVWRFRNSWGVNAGDAGYGTLAYGYLESEELCSELYVVRRLQQAAP